MEDALFDLKQKIQVLQSRVDLMDRRIHQTDIPQGTIKALHIEQQPWLTPTLLNSWVNYQTGFSDSGYYLDALNCVQLRGVIKDGSTSQTIFTLPAGYRPEKQMIFVSNANDAFARTDIFTDGTVVATTGNNTFWVLDGISFKAYQ